MQTGAGNEARPEGNEPVDAFWTAEPPSATVLPMIRRSPRSFLGVALAVGALYLLTLVPVLWIPSIGGSTEAREAHVTQSILRTGEWILPLRNGIVPSKPPLFHWVAALLSLGLGGVSPFSTRLASALFAAGTIIVTMLFGRRLFRAARPDTRPHAETLALLAGSMLASTYLFLSLAGNARVDMAFTFFVTSAAAVLLSVPANREFESEPTTKDFLAFYLLAGFATLAKGPLGVALPLVIVGACYSYLFGVGRALRILLRPTWGWLAFVIVAFPWYFFALQAGGRAFYERQLLFENVKRIIGDERMNSKPFWFYLPEFFRAAFPWSLVGAAGVFLLAESKRMYPQATDWHRRLLALPAIWVGVGVALFSLVSGKRSSYLLPLMPGLALLSAWTAAVMYERRGDEAKVRVARTLSLVPEGVAYLLFFVLLLLEFVRYAPPASSPVMQDILEWTEEVAPGLQFVSVAFIGLVAALKRRGAFAGWSAIVVAVLVFYHFTYYYGIGVKNRLNGFQGMAAAIARTVPGDANLVTVKEPFDEYFDPILFYLDRPVEITPPEKAEERCEGWMLAHGPWLESMKARGALLTESEQSFMENGYDHVDYLERRIVLFRCNRRPPG